MNPTLKMLMYLSAYLVQSAAFAQNNTSLPAPSSATVHNAMLSVAEVFANDCAGASSQGTGFVFSNLNTVVTALHVVAGCKTFQVYFESMLNAKRQKAEVRRVLQSGDLALLEFDEPHGPKPLKIRAQTLNPDESLAAIGFSTTEPTLGDKRVVLSSGRHLLSDIGDQRQFFDLRAMGIDTGAQILRFSSPLNPGMSGGPIIDSDGQVVGIVAGGQENVPAPSSWGWPAGSLIQLGASLEPTNVAARARSGVLFSIPQRDDLIRRRCGALLFTLDRRLPFNDAVKYPDDTNAQTTLVNQLQAFSQLSRQSFDVWRDGDGGATVLVPAGADLREFSDHCTAQLSGDVKEVVWGQQLLLQIPMETFVSEFERNFGIAVYGIPVAPAQPPVRFQRSDGALFLREHAVLGQSVPGQKPLPKAAIAQKAMSKGGSVVIVQIANEMVGQMAPLVLPYGGPEAPTFTQQCNTLLKGLNCDRLANSILEYVAFQLAAELSTYPRY
jgi:S1-C subfamily serine protease